MSGLHLPTQYPPCTALSLYDSAILCTAWAASGNVFIGARPNLPFTHETIVVQMQSKWFLFKPQRTIVIFSIKRYKECRYASVKAYNRWDIRGSSVGLHADMITWRLDFILTSSNALRMREIERGCLMLQIRKFLNPKKWHLKGEKRPFLPIKNSLPVRARLRRRTFKGR